MADEAPMPATLESIATEIRELSTSVDARFAAVDERFAAVDQRFAAVDTKIETSAAETRAQLGVKIEALDAKVDRVYDAVIALTDRHKADLKAHDTFTKRVDDHDVRILALERRKPKS